MTNLFILIIFLIGEETNPNYASPLLIEYLSVQTKIILVACFLLEQIAKLN